MGKKSKRQKNQKFTLPDGFELHPSVPLHYIQSHFKANCIFFARDDAGVLNSCDFILLDTAQVCFSLTVRQFAHPEPTFNENLQEVMNIATQAIAVNGVPFTLALIEHPSGKVDDTMFVIMPAWISFPDPMELVAAFLSHLEVIRNE